MRKVAVFTGTRAEYGLLYWLMHDIKSDSELKLQLLVSGTHLSPDFGNTFRQIEADGFVIDEKVECLLSSDSSVGVAKSVGLGIIGFSEALSRLSPDILIVLGDRFEALAIAQTALFLRIPVGHIHGGEITEGAYDDAIRHAITKMSQLHFTSTETYRRRVIQMGEPPTTVFNVGAPGLDHLERSVLLSLEGLSESLKIHLTKPFFLVTYHPATLSDQPACVSVQALLEALEHFNSHQIIITLPNADDSGREITQTLQAYAADRKGRVTAVGSLGQIRYLSAMKYATAIIGNSSSGIIEAPAFGTPTVNIGSRQKGRLAASCVFNCDAVSSEIRETIERAIQYSSELKNSLPDNPYGAGNVSGKILEIIRETPTKLNKKFFDMDNLA